MSDRVDQNDVMAELDVVQIQEWLDSLDYVLQHGGPEHVRRLLQYLQVHAQKAGVDLPFSANTPYINTISAENGRSTPDRKSTRLNSSHSQISYAVFCLKKKKKNN